MLMKKRSEYNPIATRKKLTMLLSCFLFLFLISVYSHGQEVKSVTGKATVPSIDKYMDIHATAPAVQFHKQYPSDPTAAQAVRMQYIVDNRDAFPEFSNEQIAEFKLQHEALTKDVIHMQQMISKGDTYEMAASRLTRQHEADKMKEHSKGAPASKSSNTQPDAPALIAQPQN